MNWKTFDEIPLFDTPLLLGGKEYFTKAYLLRIDAKGLFFDLVGSTIKSKYYLSETRYTHWCYVELPKE